MPEVNYLAVFLAALSGFVIGGLWYSPLLFAKVWASEVGLTEAQLNSVNPAKTYGLAFVLCFLASYIFAFFLGPDAGLNNGLIYGFSAGLFWVAGSFGVNYLFEQKSLKLWLINGGYHTIQFTLIGLILGLMG